jgi:hypothetical protein
VIELPGGRDRPPEHGDNDMEAPGSVYLKREMYCPIHLKILFVDDSTMSLKLMRRRIESSSERTKSWGISSHFAKTGEEALHICRLYLGAFDGNDL